MFYFGQKNVKMALKVNKCSILPKRGVKKEDGDNEEDEHDWQDTDDNGGYTSEE